MSDRPLSITELLRRVGDENLWASFARLRISASIHRLAAGTARRPVSELRGVPECPLCAAIAKAEGR